MAKETLYFTHDYGARNDPKMINLQIKHGMEGVGCYWCIVEMLYENGGDIPLEYERISFVLRTNEETIRSIINDFGLFIFYDGFLSSNSVLDRIEIRNAKSIKARESVNKRWEEHRKNTNVLKNYTNVRKNDTIKEIKEKKVKENNENEKLEFEKFWNLYDKKVGDKEKIFKKWKSLKQEDKEKIFNTLPIFLKSVTDKQYQPYPETYLNNKRWNDEIKPVNVSQPMYR